METHRRYYQDTTSGIEVTVENVTENRYEATAIIPRTILRCNELKISNNRFTINIILKVPFEELKDDQVIIRIRRGYIRGGMGLVKERPTILKFNEHECKGELVLRPRFYILPEERFNRKNVKIKSEEKKERRRKAEAEENSSIISKIKFR